MSGGKNDVNNAAEDVRSVVFCNRRIHKGNESEAKFAKWSQIYPEASGHKSINKHRKSIKKLLAVILSRNFWSQAETRIQGNLGIGKDICICPHRQA